MTLRPTIGLLCACLLSLAASILYAGNYGAIRRREMYLDDLGYLGSGQQADPAGLPGAAWCIPGLQVRKALNSEAFASDSRPQLQILCFRTLGYRQVRRFQRLTQHVYSIEIPIAQKYL